ncbi:MAG: MBL fold metallo-hydrolase [Clostridiales bacterium]|nr:MBL fold metallo-hydrolase [Clostridiales bacterium]
MTLTFYGAAHEVTGSCMLLKACGKNIVIDCGMEQGKDIFENQELSLPAGEIDCVLLTHAHIDHSGKIPMFFAQGFRGEVYSTEATHMLCDIMLRDSAHIQEFEAEWRSRKAKRAGGQPYVPLYTMDDAIGAVELFRSCPYNSVIDIADGIKIRFNDAGHLLGSASIEVWVTEDEGTEKIVFSGDIGNIEQPIINDPSYVDEADYVVVESTYGDRSHGERPDYINNLTQVIQRTFDRGGSLIIPSFAVGRTQEMLYFLREIKERGLVKGHDGFRVYVDSPLAVEATTIFSRDVSRPCFDKDTLALIDAGINPLSFDGLKLSVTSDDSKAINFDKSCKVIISASGMCEAGRIRHHLKHNLWKAENTVLFVGYQSVGTLGRSLVEGAPEVKLFGEVIKVNAEIAQLAAISGHADNEGLMRWMSSFKKAPKKVFVEHGDEGACEALASRINEELHFSAYAPYSGDCWDLSQGVCLVKNDGVRIEKTGDKYVLHGGRSCERITPAFSRLKAALGSLSEIVEQNREGANKDLAKLTDQILELCKKWRR